ncbi:MAG: aspartate-semialdehyde dehydrogenase [Bacillota bacterium]|uniref:Aspartate-semialdehyde dehydrogenase n=1 Tax=Thermanaerosceptrum fracticalcis TaxID=1712410 RepID=A0A7G6E0V5_THEFR|nr:aspartate-semialdehyde dehydrogenase [Thermanaerosceptrum fracticalcis]QNB45709.1 aspartate-semialdehyde dehydrogenase [Thermanaerosceptrum fracticalcis]
MKKLNIAVVGATGAVGTEILKILETRPYIQHIKLFATERSKGTRIRFQGKEHQVETINSQAFKGVDVALFAGGKASQEYATEALRQGAVVIDNSSTYRLHDDVPLVIPEVNPHALNNHKGLIANPNCSTIIMCMALKPIHNISPIKRIIVSTYQAVSGAGKEAIDELYEQINDSSNIQPKVFPHQIAYNLIPHIDVFQDNGFTKEEMKMVKETHKIFDDKNIAITATTVRVPVIRSHSESIYIETEEKIPLPLVRKVLADSPGVILMDEPDKNIYPMPLKASDHDEVFVGRLREDIYNPRGLNMWVVGDQLRKGAATNAVQILDELLKRNLLYSSHYLCG